MPRKSPRPTLRSHEGFAAATAKAAALEAEARACRENIRELESEFAAMRAAGRSAGDSDLESAALRLLAGDDHDTADADQLRERLQDERGRLRVLERAQELQGRAIRAERNAASRVVCDSVRPMYRGLVAEAAEAADRLGDALDAVHEFRGGLEAEGVHTSAFLGQTCCDPELLPSDDPNDSRLAKFAAEAAELLKLLDAKGGTR